MNGKDGLNFQSEIFFKPPVYRGMLLWHKPELTGSVLFADSGYKLKLPVF